MKKTLTYLALAAALLAAAGLACNRNSSAGGTAEAIDGEHVVCKHCSHDFVIPRDQLERYPASPQGEGYKCQKCEKFGALPGKQCPECKGWYLATSRGMPCPHCSKKKPG